MFECGDILFALFVFVSLWIHYMTEISFCESCGITVYLCGLLYLLGYEIYHALCRLIDHRIYLNQRE